MEQIHGCVGNRAVDKWTRLRIPVNYLLELFGSRIHVLCLQCSPRHSDSSGGVVAGGVEGGGVWVGDTLFQKNSDGRERPLN